MTAYQIFHPGSLSDIWGDFIVYRNLVPADKRLPSFQELCGSILDVTLPRKVEPAYGHWWRILTKLGILNAKREASGSSRHTHAGWDGISKPVPYGWLAWLGFYW
jgi:hypothetical protein